MDRDAITAALLGLGALGVLVGLVMGALALIVLLILFVTRGR